VRYKSSLIEVYWLWLNIGCIITIGLRLKWMWLELLKWLWLLQQGGCG
jgi:hypothetical protein